MNRTGNAYFCYVFPPLPTNQASEIYIYAFSEEQARKRFKKWFGVEPGTLIRRDPW